MRLEKQALVTIEKEVSDVPPALKGKRHQSHVEQFMVTIRQMAEAEWRKE